AQAHGGGVARVRRPGGRGGAEAQTEGREERQKIAYAAKLFEGTKTDVGLTRRHSSPGRLRDPRRLRTLARHAHHLAARRASDRRQPTFAPVSCAVSKSAVGFQECVVWAFRAGRSMR